MMIRDFQKADSERVMQIWLSGNEEAHSFVEKDYWRSNFDMVKEQLLQAEVYVCDSGEKIQGFIGIVDGYVAGIFVDKKCRSLGLGKQLLEFVKRKYDSLSLGVYEKNERAVSFYLREGFSISSKETDESTGETEYTMTWKKNREGDNQG